jgi:hypothetical protein
MTLLGGSVYGEWHYDTLRSSQAFATLAVAGQATARFSFGNQNLGGRLEQQFLRY